MRNEDFLNTSTYLAKVYGPGAPEHRVRYAIANILRDRVLNEGAFRACFETDDEDEVIRTILRRGLKNSRLSAALEQSHLINLTLWLLRFPDLAEAYCSTGVNLSNTSLTTPKRLRGNRKCVKKGIMKDPITWLYPPIEPYNTGRLRVSEVHEIYFEESGNPSGKPVVFLHGGPGGGSEPKQRRFFQAENYRIVNFDQRGCGKSTPYASLEENTTWDIVSDIEKLRRHLGIERWQVFGGSWGSTLALAYSETHSDRVTELILRGIFLFRKQEIDWFYQRGASILYPDAWESFLSHIPESERGDLLSAYHRRLTSEDAAVRLAAAKVWSRWEGITSKLLPDPAFISHYEEDEFALAFARVEAHYFANKGFLTTDDQLLRNVSRIDHIPGVIVQGRYDIVCPMESAWALHRAWPKADFIITPDGGHSAFDPPNSRALVAATDKFAGPPV